MKSKQLNLFDPIIPRCKHCGGQGQWNKFRPPEDSLSFYLDDYFLVSLSCQKCTFETDSMVKECKEHILRFWLAGVPRTAWNSWKKRNETMDEYYTWHTRNKRGTWPKPRYYHTNETYFSVPV